MTVRAETQIDLARVDDGSPGTPGTNGATFTPSVDIDGDISWTNDGGLPNPATQNIMGPQGSPGTPGANGVSVTSVEPQYYLSTSDSSATGGSWSSTPPTFVSGYYYWTRDYITFSDGTDDTSTEVYDAGMTQAAQDAYDAKTLADDTNQYFWYAPTGNDTGAHITEVPQSEWNDVSDPNYHSGGNLLARSNGIAVRDGMTELAQFGSTGAVIGNNDGTQSYLTMDYHSLQLIDINGNTFFYVSDLRDQSGEATVTDNFIGDGSTTSFQLSLLLDSGLVVEVDGVTQVSGTDYSFNSQTWNVNFITPPTDGSVITATYVTKSSRAKAYTAGIRAALEKIGPMSFAEGANIAASGSYSHAEGYYTKSSGLYSHAENYYSTASGLYSHAEGNTTTASGSASHTEGVRAVATSMGSHAEGYETTASGSCSHAEGTDVQANGPDSHAEGISTKANAPASHSQGLNTIANAYAQTVIGAYNVQNGNPNAGIVYTDNVFIIGNGSSDNSRSNALAIDWSGNIFMGLVTTAAPGTTDGDFYAAITALGWASDVIV